MKKIVLKIGGMTCSACSSGLEKYLKKQKNIEDAEVNLVLSTATITYENLSKKQLASFIEQSGFECLGEFKDIGEEQIQKQEKKHLIFFGIFLIFLMYISMGHMLHLPMVPFLNTDHPKILSTFLLLATAVFLFYGRDIIKNGIRNLFHRIPNMDTLVTFSVLFSFFYSFYHYLQILSGNFSFLHSLYFESTCMVIYFIKLGRTIEFVSKEKTKSAMKSLVQITPKNAIRKRNGQEEIVTLDEISKGDLLMIKPGDKIAVDGTVISGKTYLDESFITGESAPVLKEKGSKVLAGSLNYDGYLEYQAEKIGKDSTISEIIKLVIEATNKKSKIQKLADKISGLFVPTILVLAVLTFLIQWGFGVPFSKAFLHFITILVVACPCALGLAVPLVVVVMNGVCMKKGLLVKDSVSFEKARKIDTIVFDKTGTLTYGKLHIYKIFNFSSYCEKELLNIVANIEEKSSHPIRTAFQKEKTLKVVDFRSLDGMGVSAKIKDHTYFLGNEKLLSKLNIKNMKKEEASFLEDSGCTMIYVVENDQIIGLIGVRDTARKEIKAVIKQLQDQKIEVVMLTGDQEKAANLVAKELGIQAVIANVVPKEKEAYIKDLISNGKQVMMVGDGINDAPSLTSATIGVSIHEGTDIAMDAADVVLMNNRFENLFDFFQISHRFYKAICENLFWAFFYNFCMIPIAMGLFEQFGISMTPMIGSVAMTFSSLTVVFNSLRFGRMKV